MADYFRSSTNREADKRTSQLITQRIYNEFRYVFTVNGCSDGMFRLQVKEGSWLYQAPPRRVAYVLKQPLREELELLQNHQIIVLLGMDEVS